jgi:peroxin-2
LFGWHYGLKRKYTIIHCFVYCLSELPEQTINIVFFKAYATILRLKKKYDQNDYADTKPRQINELSRIIKLFFKMINILNGFVFLLHGKYLYLFERLLGSKPTYKRKKELKLYNHSLTFREELWHVYFSIIKIWNQIFNMQEYLKKKEIANESFSSNLNTSLNLTDCLICKKEPKVAHCSINNSCRHVYCYLCIKNELLVNANFKCFGCLSDIVDIELYVRKNK